MSSVKRSTLTSSEHGQLKAPDKWETSSKTTNALAANTSEPICDTMSSSAAAKTQTQQQSRDAQKSGNSTQQVTKVTRVRKKERTKKNQIYHNKIKLLNVQYSKLARTNETAQEATAASATANSSKNGYSIAK